jgi:hypothetical protein
MDNEHFKNQNPAASKEFNIKTPCRLAERVESYVSRNHTEITTIFSEALDIFLRENQIK